MGLLQTASNGRVWIMTGRFDVRKMEQYWDLPGESNNLEQNTSNLADQRTYDQHYPAVKEMVDVVRTLASNCIGMTDVPVILGKCRGAWRVHYEKDGWQMLHAHGYPAQIVSVVLTLEGSAEYSAALPEPDASAQIVMVDGVPGNMVIQEGSVLHAAWPAHSPRRVMAFDFEQFPDGKKIIKLQERDRAQQMLLEAEQAIRAEQFDENSQF